MHGTVQGSEGTYFTNHDVCAIHSSYLLDCPAYLDHDPPRRELQIPCRPLDTDQGMAAGQKSSRMVK